MTIFHTHRSGDELSNATRLSIARVRRRIAAALKAVHRAIIAAKLRRLRNELMLHRSTAQQAEFDATKFPRRPLILGEKWDS